MWVCPSFEPISVISFQGAKRRVEDVVFIRSTRAGLLFLDPRGRRKACRRRQATGITVSLLRW